MKKMKTTIATTVALAACVSTQLFAQNVKQDTITFALTIQGQASVSTSSTANNAGNFSTGPLYYKTTTAKFTQQNVLEAIAYVMHNHVATFYTSQATLELVQGELGGFWTISDNLAQSYADYTYTNYPPANDPSKALPAPVIGSFNGDGTASTNPYTSYYLDSVYFPYPQYGYDDGDNNYDFADYIDDGWNNNFVGGSLDNNYRNSVADNVDEFAQLDTGRHFLPVPWQSYADTCNGCELGTGTPYADTGEYPVGHMQPWGQIYVKDPGHKDAAGNPLCENVTFFFCLQVQECYDCFYLSSFITDSTFKRNNGSASGPPCCTSPNYLTGKGTDHYYLTLAFDNTVNNEYLNPSINTNYVDNLERDVKVYNYDYVGFTGLIPDAGANDGLSPDILKYSDPIRSALDSSSPYEARFTLNGIVSYAWTLEFVNSSDAAPDYVGTATFAANGYGFIGLVCQLITGTATFSEKIVKDSGCCDDYNWYDNEYNDGTSTYGGSYHSLETGWYGVGGAGETGFYGYFNPSYEQYSVYPYYDNLVGGYWDYEDGGDYLPDQFESPFNPQAALATHERENCCDIEGDRNDNNESAVSGGK